MANGVPVWSMTAASNSTADDSINWAEGQAPSSVNDSARAMMARVAEWYADTSGNLVLGGTSTAYTLTTNNVFASLIDGAIVTARVNATSGAAPTLAVDGLTAKQIRGVYGTNIPTGALQINSVHSFVYDSTDDAWIVHGFFSQSSLEDGTVSLPSLTFTADTNSGLYRIGADNIGVTLNGAKVLDVATTGLSITGTLTPSGQIVGFAGTVSAPGYAFASDLDCGLYRIGANNIGLALNGAKVVDYGTAGVAVTGTFSISSTLAVTGASTLTGALTANNSAGVTAYNSAKAFASFGVSGTTVSFTAGNYFNIATITRTADGVFSVAFTSALPTANYVVVGTGTREASPTTTFVSVTATSKLTTGFTLTCLKSSEAGSEDPANCDFAVLGF